MGMDMVMIKEGMMSRVGMDMMVRMVVGMVMKGMRRGNMGSMVVRARVTVRARARVVVMVMAVVMAVAVAVGVVTEVMMMDRMGNGSGEASGLVIASGDNIIFRIGVFFATGWAL
jgi:hypothetical protein